MWTTFNKKENRYYFGWRNKGSRKVYTRRRASYIWEQHNGKIPEGYCIHHKNLDSTDDRIENLECITKLAHYEIHGRLREDHKTIKGIEHRRCQKCRKYKPLDCFQKRNAGTYQGYCKECSYKELRKWQIKNRERVNSYAREYQRKHQKEYRRKKKLQINNLSSKGFKI